MQHGKVNVPCGGTTVTAFQALRELSAQKASTQGRVDLYPSVCLRILYFSLLVLKEVDFTFGHISAEKQMEVSSVRRRQLARILRVAHGSGGAYSLCCPFITLGVSVLLDMEFN